MYPSLIIRNSYLAEVTFTLAPATGQRVFFLDIPQLRNVFITGLEAFSRTELAFSPNGLVMVAALTGIVVTLAVKDQERFVQWPCFNLESSQNGGIIRELDRVPITLTKSFITVLDPTGLAVNQSICFNFYYNQHQK